MAVSYKKLWHILLDRDMKKKDLQASAGLTAYAINKLSRNEDVTTDILGRICKALDCSTEDIMEFLPDEQQSVIWDKLQYKIKLGSQKYVSHSILKEKGTKQDEQATVSQ